MLVLLAPTSSWAFEEWLVTPQVCVTESDSDLCTMRVNISLPEIVDEHCFLIEQQVIRCVAPGVHQITLHLTLEAPVTLQVQNVQRQIVQETRLNIQYRSPQKRRRIRTPWNVF